MLKDAILTTEDQHFEEHWGVDFTRVAGAAWRNFLAHRVAEGASTLTMQLAGTLFLDRSDRTMRRKIQETLLASIQIGATIQAANFLRCTAIRFTSAPTEIRRLDLPRNIISESPSAN